MAVQILPPILVEEPVAVTAERGELAHSVLPLCSQGTTLTIIFKEDNMFAKTVDIVSPPSLGQMNPLVPLTQATADCIWKFSFLASVKKLLAGAENCGLQPRDLEPKYQRGKSQFLTTA